MSLMNVLDALHNPKGITSHSQRPSRVLKAIFHSSPGQIRIWWYPLRRSSLENTREPESLSNISSKCGIGKRYLTVILLTARLSTHIRHVPSFFGTKSAGTAHGLKLGRTSFFCTKSSTKDCKISCSFGLNQ